VCGAAPLDGFQGGAKAEQITVGAKTRELTQRDGGDHRAVPELLAGVDVGQVDLDNG